LWSRRRRRPQAAWTATGWCMPADDRPAPLGGSAPALGCPERLTRACCGKRIRKARVPGLNRTGRGGRSRAGRSGDLPGGRSVFRLGLISADRRRRRTRRAADRPTHRRDTQRGRHAHHVHLGADRPAVLQREVHRKRSILALGPRPFTFAWHGVSPLWRRLVRSGPFQWMRMQFLRRRKTCPLT
jgi:hypothetical protein